PSFARAAPGPLVAVWFARRYPARSPYPLYAVSNLGSLVALLAYPFALEPYLPLSATGQIWSLAFAATGIAVIACATLAWRTPAAAVSEATEVGTARDRSPARGVLWVLLSACAVVLLMGTTNQLCLDTASIPFLWILPLGIYLASLIICFGAPRAYRRLPFVVLALVTYFSEDVARWFGAGDKVVDAFGGLLPFAIWRQSLLLFALCMLLHGELYRLRPPPRWLTAFYLYTSGGGALGGLLVGLGAPRPLDGFYEYPLALGLSWVLLLAACRTDPTGWFGRNTPKWRFGVAVALVGSAIGFRGAQLFAKDPEILHQERSFFGVLRVQQKVGVRPYRVLMHGSTAHGSQAQGMGWENKPTTYYGMHTGIELALGLRDPNVPAEIGVVGLGTGTIAAYGRDGDHIRYFEIDPAVIHLTRDEKLFTFLARSKAGVDIIQGDGRISLERERARNAPLFDYLIIDAYSSDSVPVHLLTREALALYVDSLA